MERILSSFDPQSTQHLSMELLVNELFDRLMKCQNWIQVLRKACKHPDLKLKDLAKLVEDMEIGKNCG